jgi:hypothetical protein
MGELELTRTPGERRLYALTDVGTVRLKGWASRAARADGDHELAVFEGRGWGGRPVKITVDDPRALDPGLLLFAAFVVRGLGEDASAAVGATASGA